MVNQTLFTNQIPNNADATDGVSYELGMKFQSSRPGTINAIRYWKAPSDTGTHVGNIWSSAGTLLATATFTNETASGWQEQTLSTPLSINANITYVVSVNISSHFPITIGGLANSVVNGDLSSVADGNNGVFSNANQPGTFPTNSFQNSNYFRDVVFTEEMSQTLFTTQVPNNADATDGVSYELGMKFQSSRSGTINAIRYWKAPSDTGTHVGNIWSSTGTLLATATFTNETASGWQEQALSTPLSIEANTTYVVSVNISSHFPITTGGLANSVANGDLSSIADGNNGVFSTPNQPGTFPNNSFQNSNYFRDIVFVASVTPTIIKVSGDRQSGAGGTTLTDPLVVQVNDGSGSPLEGVTVNFTVTSGGGSVSPTSSVTAANGQASTALTLGTTTGINTVEATGTDIGTVSFTAIANPNAIYLENQNPGTRDWEITNRATANEIAGYAGATSVNRGDSLPLKISLAQPGQYTIDVYRLGFYGGEGGRLIFSSGLLNGVTQPACVITDQATRLIECNWSTSFTLNVGTDWTTGLYIAKLIDQTTTKQSEIWFVVRDDSSTSDVLFQSSFTTFLAYSNFNTTGGQRYSLYGFNSAGGQRAFKVSFDRPFSQTTYASGEFNTLLRWEYNMARWLESQSYDISYVTNLDVHTNPQFMQNHQVFLSVGHDEYWSLEERDRVEQARDDNQNPKNIAFFSANTAYWRVRFENSSTGEPNRVMVCYKDAWQQDPVAPTNKFRSPQNNRPESALLGVKYIADEDVVYAGFDFTVSNSADPYYANTNLVNGDTLSRLVGFEWDRVNTGQTLFTNQVPSNPNATDGVSYELGMKFQSSSPGTINAIRYWKAPSDTGTHVGNIWSSAGTLLASATFTNETASGWQEQALSTPLSINANTTYVVSVNISSHFPITTGGLANSVANGDLSSVADGNNGVFSDPNQPGTFPTNSFQNSNYFRDVVFFAAAAFPNGLVILSQSQFTGSPDNIDLEGFPPGTDPNVSNAVRYTAASGAKVFSTGSIQWMWGLDSDRVTNPREDPRAQQIAVNVLADMGAQPLTPGTNIIIP